MPYPDGAAIRRYRTAKGWTEKELLAQCNCSDEPGKVTKQMLSRMETGKAGYVLEWALQRLAGALGVRRNHITLFSARSEAIAALVALPEVEPDELLDLVRGAQGPVRELARRTGRSIFLITERERSNFLRYWEQQRQPPEHLALRFLSERVVLVNAARLGGPLPRGSALSDLAKPVCAQLVRRLHGAERHSYFEPGADLQRNTDRQVLAEQIRAKVASGGTSGTGTLALAVWERQSVADARLARLPAAERRRSIERIRAAIGRLLKGSRCHPEARLLQDLAGVFGILPSQLLRLDRTTRELIALSDEASIGGVAVDANGKDRTLELEEIRSMAESTYGLLTPRRPNEHFCWLTGDVQYWSEQPPEQRAESRLRACLLAIRTVLENAARKRLIIREMEHLTFLRDLACDDIRARVRRA